MSEKTATKTDVTFDGSLYDYIVKEGLERKLIDIAIATEKTPNHLRADAEQEIRTMWAQYKPDMKYKRGQIAAYAHKMAGHAVLRLKREIGAAVRLPGSAFRKREDGSTYANPGVLTASLSWDEVEEWMNLEEQVGDASLMAHVSEMGGPGDPSQAVLSKDRIRLIQAKTHLLSKRQQLYLAMLLKGHSLAEIQVIVGVARCDIMFDLEAVKSLMDPDRPFPRKAEQVPDSISEGAICEPTS